MAVDQAELLTQLIADELSLGDMATLVKLRRGDLELPAGCMVVAVLRDNGVLLPRSDLHLRAEDEVLAVVHAGATAHPPHLLGDPRR